MAMYEVGTVSGAANQSKVTGVTTKWKAAALGIMPGSILVIYRGGTSDLYAIKSADSDTQLTLTRNITTAFSGASYGIITAETASTSAFANQLASAFGLWRNVVAGWSAALTGNGNITLTDPMTGTEVTVPAINGMAKLAGGNLLTGNQIISSDDSGFILGRNSDIGLVKKNGTWGKLMVGKSTRFSVVKGANDKISPTDIQTEIFGVSPAGEASSATLRANGAGVDYLPLLQGATISWNRQASMGRTDFINHRGKGEGGFDFWNTDGKNVTRIAGIGANGDMMISGQFRPGSVYSQGGGVYSRAVVTDVVSKNEYQAPGTGSILYLQPYNKEITTILGARIVSDVEDYGFVSYKDFGGSWNELRIRNGGNVETASGHISAIKQEGTTSTGDWYMGGRIRGVAAGMGGPTGNLRFEMYVRDNVGYMSSVVIEAHTYSGRRDLSINADGQIVGPLGTVAQNGSDIRLKTEIMPSASGARERIEALGTVEFTWIDTGKRERGFIAQQAELVDGLYTELNLPQQDRDFRILTLKDRAILADLVDTVQELSKENRELKEKIAQINVTMNNIKMG